MQIQLHYGKGTTGILIPDSVDVTVLEPTKMVPADPVGLSHKAAFDQAATSHPAILPLRKGKPTVAFTVPDDSRALPLSKVLKNTDQIQVTRRTFLIQMPADLLGAPYEVRCKYPDGCVAIIADFASGMKTFTLTS